MMDVVFMLFNVNTLVTSYIIVYDNYPIKYNTDHPVIVVDINYFRKRSLISTSLDNNNLLMVDSVEMDGEFKELTYVAGGDEVIIEKEKATVGFRLKKGHLMNCLKKEHNYVCGENRSLKEGYYQCLHYFPNK